MIPLGVGYGAAGRVVRAHVVPRSSTYKNFGVIQANHMGVIDNSYRGDNDQWMFPAIALTDTHIPKGTRICQFRVVEKQPPITFETVGAPDRPRPGRLRLNRGEIVLQHQRWMKLYLKK